MMYYSYQLFKEANDKDMHHWKADDAADNKAIVTKLLSLS